MLTTKEIQKVAQRRFDAWECGQIDALLDIYSDDCTYWDTNATTGITGKMDLLRYLADLLGRYDFRFVILEEHRLESRDAAMVMWQAVVRSRLPGGLYGSRLVLQRGMSLLEFDGELVRRDESYMDLMALASLGGMSPDSPKEREHAV